MIRGAVIHMVNEQPLVADLFSMPSSTDVGLVCTNLRTLSNKRPVFADHGDSVFFFPYSHVRFVEIHPGSEGAPALSSGEAERPVPSAAPAPDADDVEIDEDFLRRVREA